jgi:hypothetical protein
MYHLLLATKEKINKHAIFYRQIFDSIVILADKLLYIRLSLPNFHQFDFKNYPVGGPDRAQKFCPVPPNSREKLASISIITSA